MKLNNKFTKIAAALSVATSLTGCMDASMGGGMSSADSAKLGRAMGRAAGIAVSESIQSKGDDTATKIVRTIGLGRTGAEIGSVLGKQAGNPCTRTIKLDNLAGHATSDRSRCVTSHGLPAGLPIPKY